MTALASAGISTSASYDISTSTSVPDGVTLSTVPTATPSTRTSLPSKTEMARGNFAVRVLRSSPSSIATANATSRATIIPGTSSLRTTSMIHPGQPTLGTGGRFWM